MNTKQQTAIKGTIYFSKQILFVSFVIYFGIKKDDQLQPSFKILILHYANLAKAAFNVALGRMASSVFVKSGL